MDDVVALAQFQSLAHIDTELDNIAPRHLMAAHILEHGREELHSDQNIPAYIALMPYN